jgi:hypothetical protein
VKTKIESLGKSEELYYIRERGQLGRVGIVKSWVTVGLESSQWVPIILIFSGFFIIVQTNYNLMETCNQTFGELDNMTSLALVKYNNVYFYRFLNLFCFHNLYISHISFKILIIFIFS